MKRSIDPIVVFGRVSLLMVVSGCEVAQTPPVAEDQVVGKMEQLNGITPGARRNHIQGVCASGSFVGAKAA